LIEVMGGGCWDEEKHGKELRGAIDKLEEPHE
jgi:hypothetical protein